jgi:hypothetical protein
MNTSANLTEARRQVTEARIRFETATTTKARREADEDLVFWTGKSAAYSLTEESAS